MPTDFSYSPSVDLVVRRQTCCSERDQMRASRQLKQDVARHQIGTKKGTLGVAGTSDADSSRSFQRSDRAARDRHKDRR